MFVRWKITNCCYVHIGCCFVYMTNIRNNKIIKDEIQLITAVTVRKVQHVDLRDHMDDC